MGVVNVLSTAHLALQGEAGEAFCESVFNKSDEESNEANGPPSFPDWLPLV